MIGVPMPDPRKSVIADLNEQMKAFFGDGNEVQQIAIMKMDLKGDDELAAFSSYPRHEIVINENVARKFQNASPA